MPKITVQSEILINQPREYLIDYLADFRNWPAWSPWLVLEPNCPVICSGIPGLVGHDYHWEGQLLGSGRMVLREKTPDRLEMGLALQHPIVVKAVIVIKIQPQDQGCKLIWLTEFTLSWAYFYLKKRMKFNLCSDFQRGFSMLKNLLEKDSIRSRLERVGLVDQPGLDYIGIEVTSELGHLGTVVEENLARLSQFCAEQAIEPTGPPFTLYKKLDLHTFQAEYVTAIPVAQAETVEAPFCSGSISATPAYVSRHIGDRAFVSNGWAQVNLVARRDKLKLHKQYVGLERYLNDPADTDIARLQTEVVLFCH
jgi:hypothetical protein